MINLIKKGAIVLRNYFIYVHYDLLSSLKHGLYPLDSDANFVISIASYPERIHLLPAVFESISRQSKLPRYFFLVLSEEEWPGKILPKKIKKLERRGVRVVWTRENPYAVKMLLPILELNLNLSIITLGDDWIYGREFIENTVCSTAAKSGYITGPLGKSIFRRGQEINVFFREENGADPNTPSECLYLLGLGTIYPPGSLDLRVRDMAAVRRIVPGRGSDLWFWAAATAKGTKQVCLGYDSVKDKLIPIPETKSTKPKDAPGLDVMNDRFQKAIDFFGIRTKLLEILPDRDKI